MALKAIPIRKYSLNKGQKRSTRAFNRGVERGHQQECRRIAKWLDDMAEGKTAFPVYLPRCDKARWWILKIIGGIANHIEKDSK